MSHNTYTRRGWFSSLALMGMTGVLLSAPPGVFAQTGTRPNPGDNPPIDPDGEEPEAPECISQYRLFLEPIPGLTSGRYGAPALLTVPLGTQVTLYQESCADEPVVWEGAQVESLDSNGSRGLCPMDVAGRQTIRILVAKRDGTVRERTCEIVVLDVPLDRVSVNGITWDKVHLPATEQSTNQQTMSAFFGYSIAAVRQVGPNQYRTSVNKPLMLHAIKTRPGKMAPLMEWRIDDQPVALGESYRLSFGNPGTHKVSVGPLERERTFEIETYEVQITSHQAGLDLIPEGLPVTFTAVTVPPGYENEITWVSSTKYGTGTPIVGHGPTFTVEFSNTFGLDPGGGLRQWLGVKADVTVRGQDQNQVPCDLAQDIILSCDQGSGLLSATAVFANGSLNGASLLFGVEDVGVEATIVGTQASISVPNMAGTIEVTLLQVAGTACNFFLSETVQCAVAAAQRCEVQIDEVTYDNCDVADCGLPIIGNYCTNRDCFNNANCAGINKVARRCQNHGICVGTTAAAPRTCTCP